jgi:hypothetical protein
MKKRKFATTAYEKFKKTENTLIPNLSKMSLP